MPGFFERVAGHLSAPFKRPGMILAVAAAAASGAAVVAINRQKQAERGANAAANSGLKELLDRGESVVGTKHDSLSPLSSMSEADAQKHGYMDSNGFWTERGYNRATSADWERFQDSHDAFSARAS